MKTKKLLAKNLRYVLLAGVAALGLITILATGGGGGVTTTTSGTTYNSGGSIGDLLTYTINTSNLSYSYNIVESDFELAGTTGSGTLTHNDDGTYTPSSDPNARLILLPNTLLVGGADLTVSGNPTTMLFAGVPALTTSYTATEIAGIYNYINFQCDDSLDSGQCAAGYKSYYGTFKVDAGGTWEASDGDLGATPPAAVVNSGTWKDLGNGRISVVSGGNEIVKMMLLPSASGGKVMIGDLKNVDGVQGPGIIVGVKRQDLSSLDLSGQFTFNDDDGGYGNVTVTNASDPTYTGTHHDSAGGSQDIGGTLTRNDPWTGWLRDNADGTIVLILPGDGVWFDTQQAPNNDWIGIGGAIP
ncbi:MAG: hypothetical protein JRF46_05535 [Deltaproteobacteria bacterium]|nr:hypothetical protein [Deltaproteobacteria bacterium]